MRQVFEVPEGVQDRYKNPGWVGTDGTMWVWTADEYKAQRLDLSTALHEPALQSVVESVRQWLLRKLGEQ